MSDNAKTRGQKRSILVPVLLVITLAACCAAGYAVWRMMNITNSEATGSKHTAKHAEVPVVPVFLPLNTFTVNLVTPDNDPDRVLYVGFTLRLPDDETRIQISEYLPAVRSRLLLLLSRQSATTLATEQGKQDLIEQIKQTIAPPLVKGQPPLVVNDVLFTAFILR